MEQFLQSSSALWYFDIFLIMLERPAVQRQLAALVVILVVAILLPGLINRKLLKDSQEPQPAEGEKPPEPAPSPVEAPAASSGYPTEFIPLVEEVLPIAQERFVRLLRGFNFMLLPIIWLLGSALVTTWFTSQGWPTGLITALSPFFWLFMAYRVAAGIFLATMPRHRAQKYINTFLKPAAILLTSVVIRDLLFSQLAARDFVLIGFQSIQISLGSLLRFVSLVAAYYLAAVVLSALAQQLLRRVNVEQGVQATTINIMRYSIFGIGVLLALSLFGLDLTTLAVVFGGLSVGIGFGLNELISNVISGILLAFERLIRPGDTIEVGGVRGVVTEVRMRSTILRTFDRVQVIVPNKNMLTSVVSAFTSWETTVSRLSLEVSVDFQTDPERVRSILLNLVTGHPKVLREPTPSAIVTAIGPYSIEIQIFAFVAEFYQTFSVRSELYAMIWEEFRRLGIAIPYPRQEVMMNGPLDAGDSSLSAGSVPATDA